MLIKDLYTIHSFDQSVGKIVAAININEGHEIFQGHFPGQPVLPGVCQVQIIKELLEKSTAQNLFLDEATAIKFLQMINPLTNPALTIRIDYFFENDAYNCTAIMNNEDVTFLKMSGKFLVAG